MITQEELEKKVSELKIELALKLSDYPDLVEIIRPIYTLIDQKILLQQEDEKKKTEQGKKQ